MRVGLHLDDRLMSGADGIGRRRFAGLLASAAGLPLLGGLGFGRAAMAADVPLSPPTRTYPLFEEAVSRVVPEAGFQSGIAFGDSILRLLRHGVIDRGKLFALYGTSGGLPAELARALQQRSPQKLLLTAANAGYAVNLLWPIGLATAMAANVESPLNGESLYHFASTGGWTLGREPNGGAYFSRYPIVDLTEDAEALVVRIAKSTHRPCCNNSTFFQDCNHGSALLGLLQLGASQGLGQDELYREALAFNSFWFPQYYIRTALYFKIAKWTDWNDVDPRVVLGYDYSAGGPWQENVGSPIAAIQGLIPEEPDGSAACAL